MTAALAPEPWVQCLGWALLHFLWQGTLIVILYAALRALLGRSMPPAGRYALACAALGAMAAAPPLTFLFLLLSDGRGTPAAWAVPEFGWGEILPGVVAAWMLGAALLSLRLAMGWSYTRRLCAAAHPAPAEWQRLVRLTAARVGATRPVRLLVSSLVEVPVAIGWLRPAILVPFTSLTALPIEQLSAVLAHELAHIRRNDYLAAILQNLAEALLFYHPAVWWASRQIRIEREFCCDDLWSTPARTFSPMPAPSPNWNPAGPRGSIPPRRPRACPCWKGFGGCWILPATSPLAFPAPPPGP